MPSTSSDSVRIASAGAPAGAKMLESTVAGAPPGTPARSHFRGLASTPGTPGTLPVSHPRPPAPRRRRGTEHPLYYTLRVKCCRGHCPTRSVSRASHRMRHERLRPIGRDVRETSHHLCEAAARQHVPRDHGRGIPAACTPRPMRLRTDRPPGRDRRPPATCGTGRWTWERPPPRLSRCRSMRRSAAPCW